MTLDTIEWTPDKLKELKAAYRQARSEGNTVLMFNSIELTMESVRLLIDYLEGRFRRRED